VKRVWYLRGQKIGPRVGGQLMTRKLRCAKQHYGTGFAGIVASGERKTPDAIIAAAFRARGPVAPSSLASEKELSDFLKNVEKRAFKRALYAVRDDEAALDIVQDAMIRLAEKYGDRPAAELPLVFQRILSNATMDWFRRQKVRGAIMKNFSDFESAGEDGDFDILETLEALNGSTATESAAESVSRAQILLAIEAQIGQLPGRQREAFLLRYWEELDVAETAAVMGCSEGSVKTHCSRAVHALAKALKAKGIEL
jgi:RNA polymerase sigma-70 factor (ECF subfamily)